MEELEWDTKGGGVQSSGGEMLQVVAYTEKPRGTVMKK